ncbi:GNAT family N-acetyltransferase [Chitinophaga lutea]
METKLLEVTDNVNARQFEARANGQLARIEYMEGGKKIFLMHIDVPPALEKKGIKDAMLERVLRMLEERKIKMVPMTPYIVQYLRNHPEWKRIVAHGINI